MGASDSITSLRHRFRATGATERAEFVESVRSRSHFVAPIEDAIRSDTISHVSLLAIQSGQEVVWDPQAYRFTSPTSLNSALARPARGDWLRPV